MEYHLLEQGKLLDGKMLNEKIQFYRHGKTILKTHDIVRSDYIVEQRRDNDDHFDEESDEREDPWVAYQEEKRRDSEENDTAVDEAHEEYVEERTGGWVKYESLHTTGWYEDD